MPTDLETNWKLVKQETDPNGQIKQVYRYKNGKPLFKLINTFYGNDKAPFRRDWLKFYSVYTYDEHGDFVDGDSFEAGRLKEATLMAGCMAEQMLKAYSPTLMRDGTESDDD